MQAIKQAAREGDSARLDALCDAWAVTRESVAREPETVPEPQEPAEPQDAAPGEAQIDASADARIETRVKTRVGVRR
jgi:hypothetical protein